MVINSYVGFPPEERVKGPGVGGHREASRPKKERQKCAARKNNPIVTVIIVRGSFSGTQTEGKDEETRRNFAYGRIIFIERDIAILSPGVYSGSRTVSIDSLYFIGYTVIDSASFLIREYLRGAAQVAFTIKRE